MRNKQMVKDEEQANDPVAYVDSLLGEDVGRMTKDAFNRFAIRSSKGRAVRCCCP